MDEDIFSDIGGIDVKRTYSQKNKKFPVYRSSYNNKQHIEEVEEIQPLTTKVAVTFLLDGKLKSKVCRYCLNISPGLSELDQIMKIAGTGSLYKVTIRDIVASFHPFKVVEDPNFPNKICQKCLDRALQAYLFTQQCERAERAMRNCFDDIYEKFEKLDPIDRPKKRGRQKQNPNPNVLYAEHNKVIDYAEPIINIINIETEGFSKEPELNEFECKKCWQVLPNMDSLLNHEAIHPKTMWYHCRLCGKSFPKRNQLKKHNNKAHILGNEVQPSVDKDFICKECGHTTESLVQHIQHVEKHNFRNLMEHIIEKRTSDLCAVCFKKGNIMTDLDKMVCIHGGHPDLMGDKTLYNLLASTLPKPKSYKYEESYVPSHCPIMTLRKRHSSDEQNSRKVNTQINIECMKEDWIFSKPLFVYNKRIKNHHFYHYVFTDPDVQKDAICDTIVKKDKVATDMYSFKTNVKVTEIYELQNGIPSEKSKSTYTESKEKGPKKAVNIKVTPKAMKLSPSENVISKLPIIKNDFNTFSSRSNKFTTENDIRTYDLNEINNLKSNLPECENSLSKQKKTLQTGKHIIKEIEKSETLLTSECTLPTYRSLIGAEFSKDRTAKQYDCDRLSKDQCDNQWVFKNTYKIEPNETKTLYLDIKPAREHCKFCWVFKHLAKCDYCNKPNKKIEVSCQTIGGVDTKLSNNNQILRKENKVKEEWQCKICLIKNRPDRFTCHCCENARITEYSDIKINFGISDTFFNFQKQEHPEISNSIDKEDNNVTQKDITEISAVRNTANIICKENKSGIYSQVNPEAPRENVEDIPTIQIIDMETETLSPFKVGSNNDSEEMDIEESPSLVNIPTMTNFSADSNYCNRSVGTPIAPLTNIQFNIGCVSQNKTTPRKFKRAVRSISRAFHK